MKKYLSDFLELVKQFHPTKNGDLRPKDFTFGSGKKIWWKCPKGDDHEWLTSISHRVGQKTGCPFCIGKKVSKTNNLLVNHPEVAREWHPVKNRDLKPDNVTLKSNKRVWWKCPKGDDHEWLTSISHRVGKKTGCPFCIGQKVSKTNNFLYEYPKIAKEWHPTKNGDLKPENFNKGSSKKIWWKCPKGDDHEWEVTINNRTLKKRNCPFCSGRKASKTSNLVVFFPDIAKEWHLTKNGNSRPEDYKPHAGKKVWWQCPKDKTHEYETYIFNRTNHSSGCPFCSSSGTSEPEIRIFCELNYLIGADEVVWRKKIDGNELDVFISKYNLGIEFDGSYWHEGKIQSDIHKNKLLKKKNIQIIRVRQEPLEFTSENDIAVSKKTLTKEDLNNLVLKIKSVLNETEEINFGHYISKTSFLNDKGFKRFISFFPAPPPEYSFLTTHPELAKEWNYQKNTPLKPEYFTYGSGKKVWWKCSKNEEHEWESSILNRSYGNGCPFCSGRKHSKKKSNSYNIN